MKDYLTGVPFWFLTSKAGQVGPCCMDFHRENESSAVVTLPPPPSSS